MQKTVVVSWIGLACVVALLLATSCGPECINIIQSDYHAEPTIERHYIHTASATILALTVFGSVLSVRIVADPNNVKAQTKGILAIFAGVIAIVAIHVHIMISTCCVSWTLTQSAYACLLVLTMLLMFLLLLGFGALVSAQLEAAKQAGTRKYNIKDDQDEYAIET